ncbi:MAG: hypothetical protein V9G15_06165 [Dermatophilaceae bacterium]
MSAIVATRGARALHGGAAIDGDARGDGIEVVHRRALEALQELARVRAEALDEAALALGVERVEGERRLAGAAHAGDADELSGAEVERDSLEVVGSGAAQTEIRAFPGSGRGSWGRGGVEEGAEEWGAGSVRARGSLSQEWEG